MIYLPRVQFDPFNYKLVYQTLWCPSWCPQWLWRILVGICNTWEAKAQTRSFADAWPRRRRVWKRMALSTIQKTVNKAAKQREESHRRCRPEVSPKFVWPSRSDVPQRRRYTLTDAGYTLADVGWIFGLFGLFHLWPIKGHAGQDICNTWRASAFHEQFGCVALRPHKWKTNSTQTL